MKRILFLFFVVFIVQQGAVFSQSAIYGKVTDENGNPLVGANLVLKNTLYGQSTNSNGKFTFKNLKTGEYSLQATYMGFEKKTVKVEVPENQTKELTISLSRKDIMTGEIVVASTRASEKTPVAYQNIEKEEIERTNTGQDIPFLLSMTPSITTNSDAGAGIGYTTFRIRGTDLNRVNVTLNGIPLNDSESHGVWWVNMPDLASSLENIQVQRGVGTSTNGAAAFGASINLQTQSVKQEAYADINATYGSFNTQKANILAGTGLINDHFTFDARTSRLTSDGYIDRAWTDLKSFYLSGAYHSKKSILRVSVISGEEHTYQAWDGIPSYILEDNRTYNGIGAYTDEFGNQQYYNNETDNYWQNHYQLHYSLKLTRNLLLNTALHFTQGEGYYEQYKEDEDCEDYQMPVISVNGTEKNTTDLIRQKWLDNDFYGMIYALNYDKNKLNITVGGGWNKYDGRHFGNVIWARFAGKSEMNHQWYRSKGIKTDWNSYVKLNFVPLDKLNVFADLQYRNINYEIDGIDDDLRNITQQHDFNFFNPKAGLFYKLSNNQDIYVSYAIANREPNRSNYTDAPNGETPTAETLYNLEAGYKFRSTNIAATINIYNMDYKDQLVLTGQINDVGAPIMVNIPESYRRGVEFELGLKPFDNFKWQMNATFSRNKIISFTEYVDDWDTWTQRSENLGNTDLSFSPEVIAASTLTYTPIKQLDISLLSKYVGEQYIDNTSSSERMLDAYFVNNVLINYSFSTRFTNEVSIQLMANNILNEEYETNAWVYRYYEGNDHKVFDGYYPQAGRHYMCGISIKF